MHKIVAGIDEAGRGPLAGHLFVGIVCLHYKAHSMLIKNRQVVHGGVVLPLRDSKKLSENQRKLWVSWMRNNKIYAKTSRVSPGVIDAINISKATHKAAKRLVLRVFRDYPNASLSIVADGGINIGDFKSFSRRIKFSSFSKADEIIPAVSLASVIAKVARDKTMKALHSLYPRYGFLEHKGYGTKNHIRMIKKYGHSPAHRLTFIGKYNNIKQ